ncbi:unnamed protein product [Caenorhabditis bovis]|uniref:Vesicle transport protein USE1 n=1 Tax=Caenorhabditis bovis TaxID=2654633 RepID=A0A8S1F0Q1_9PELO|nr:unnamed protein product [Caenorhabditis bovis]
MTQFSNTELVFLRLLERTKRLTKENLKANVWKVSAATKVLNNLISQLQYDNDDSAKDMLIDYRREVVQLKLLTEAEEKATTEESLKIVEKIPRFFPTVNVNPSEDSIHDDVDEFKKESAAGLRALQKSIYRSDLRKQLLSTKKHKNVDTTDENFMKNERIEEDLAKDLLSMTLSLKTVMSAANDVIKEDNQKLTKMQQQVDKNKEALQTENTRLEHHAYKCGFDCMRIFLVVFIFWTFIAMVIVMKVFPKRYSS